MTFKKFMYMYDNWNEIVKVNDDDLGMIAIGRISDILKNHTELHELEVASFGFYDNELCIRVA